MQKVDKGHLCFIPSRLMSLLHDVDVWFALLLRNIFEPSPVQPLFHNFNFLFKDNWEGKY